MPEIREIRRTIHIFAPLTTTYGMVRDEDALEVFSRFSSIVCPMGNLINEKRGGRGHAIIAYEDRTTFANIRALSPENSRISLGK